MTKELRPDKIESSPDTNPILQTDTSLARDAWNARGQQRPMDDGVFPGRTRAVGRPFPIPVIRTAKPQRQSVRTIPLSMHLYDGSFQIPDYERAREIADERVVLGDVFMSTHVDDPTYREARDIVRRRFQAQVLGRQELTMGLRYDNIHQMQELREMLREVDAYFPSERRLKMLFKQNRLEDEQKHNSPFFRIGWRKPMGKERMAEIIEPLLSLALTSEFSHYHSQERTAALLEVMSVFQRNPRLVLGAFFPTKEDYFSKIGQVFSGVEGQKFSLQGLHMRKALHLGCLFYK